MLKDLFNSLVYYFDSYDFEYHKKTHCYKFNLVHILIQPQGRVSLPQVERV